MSPKVVEKPLKVPHDTKLIQLNELGSIQKLQRIPILQISCWLGTYFWTPHYEAPLEPNYQVCQIKRISDKLHAYHM